jgi:hypothetical protein
MQLGRRRERGVGNAGVVERPAQHFFHEIALERRERRAFGAREHDHDCRAVGEAVVEQVAGQRVVLGVRAQLAHVFGGAESAHAGARTFLQLGHQLDRNCGLEQLLLTRKVFVQVADRRAGARRHVGHGGRLEAELREGCCCSSRKSLAHVLFGDLDHIKENNIFAFSGLASAVGARTRAAADATRPTACGSAQTRKEAHLCPQVARRRLARRLLSVPPR